MPSEFRVSPLLSVGAEEGTWVLSELTVQLIERPPTVTDLCGLAEQFRNDGTISGTFEFLVGDEGEVLGASEITVR